MVASDSRDTEMAIPPPPPPVNKKSAETAPAPTVFEEVEKDDEPCTDMKEEVIMVPHDSTIDCLVSGATITSLASEAFQHLLAGARGSHGVKKGARVYFEVQMVEMYTNENAKLIVGGSVQDVQCVAGGVTGNRVIGPVEGTTGFDVMRGTFFSNGKQSKLENFNKEEQLLRYAAGVYGILINRTDEGEGKNSISLFMNGRRMCKPQPLPECWNDLAIFPTVSFAGCGVLANFGSTNPKFWSPPAFKVRSFQTSAAKDLAKSAVVAPGITKGKDKGKMECIMHIGVPDQATYDYLDDMYKKNFGKYVEVGDRAIAMWAQASESKTWSKEFNAEFEEKIAMAESSNDQPVIGAGVSTIDEFSCKRMMVQMAAGLRRNFVVAGVEQNLQSGKRAAILKKFSAAWFKRIAQITVGKPTAEFQKLQHDFDRVHLQKAKDKKTQEKRAELQKVRDEAKAERDALRKEKRAAREAEHRKLVAESGSDIPFDESDPLEGVPEPDEKTVEETYPDEPVQISSDQYWRKKRERVDVLKEKMEASFIRYTIPKAEEGFDEVVDVFDDNATEYLATWKRNQKLSHPVEVKPGDEFTEEYESFSQQLNTWKELGGRCNAILNTAFETDEHRIAREASDAKMRADMQSQLTLDVTRESTDSSWGGNFVEQNGRIVVSAVIPGSALATSGVQPGNVMVAANGQQVISTDQLDGVMNTSMTVVVRPASAGDDQPPVEPAGTYAQQLGEIDVWRIENIDKAIGNVPLYGSFSDDDWKMCRTRFQFHCMLTNFTKDIKYADEDHPGMHKKTLASYFKQYYKKNFHAGEHGTKSLDKLLNLLEDTMCVDEDTGLIEAVQETGCPFDVFIKITEEARRERIERLAAGDETARLKFSVPPPTKIEPPPASSWGTSYTTSYKGGYKGKGKGKGKGYQGNNYNPAYARQGSTYNPATAPPSKAATTGGTYGNQTYGNSTYGQSSYNNMTNTNNAAALQAGYAAAGAKRTYQATTYGSTSATQQSPVAAVTAGTTSAGYGTYGQTADAKRARY